MDGLDIQCRPTERNPGRIALDRHFGSSHIHRVRPGSWKWYRAYYRRRVHHRFVLGVRLFVITHGMSTLTPNQPSAVGAVSSAVAVHAAAWPRRPAASLRRPFPSLRRPFANLWRPLPRQRQRSLAFRNHSRTFGNAPLTFRNHCRRLGNGCQRLRLTPLFLENTLKTNNLQTKTRSKHQTSIKKHQKTYGH